MKWFRFYNETMHDPKVQRLPAELFRVWVNLLCIASENAGVIPSDMENLAFTLRTTPQKMAQYIEALKHAELLDQDETLHPHNWTGRQYKSDDVATRVKRYRERNGNDTSNVPCNVTETAKVTPPDTEQNRTEQIDANASPNDRLWKLAVPYLKDRGGKSEAQARTMLGKWISQSGADAVMTAVSRAQAEKVVEPVAFITACLKPMAKHKPVDDIPGYRPMPPGGC